MDKTVGYEKDEKRTGVMEDEEECACDGRKVEGNMEREKECMM